jgi:hypothetical protein
MRAEVEGGPPDAAALVGWTIRPVGGGVNRRANNGRPPLAGRAWRGVAFHPFPARRAYTVAMKRMGAVEWSLLLALSVLWGGSFFFQKVALAALPPFTRANPAGRRDPASATPRGR